MIRDYYDLAKRKEREFYRKWQSKTPSFWTGLGKQNVIVQVDRNSIEFRTEKSAAPNKITRRQFRYAITHVFYKRTVTRRDLEAFSAFTSALMGLLQAVFAQVGKIHKTAHGLLRLTLKGLRFYFSGVEKNALDLKRIAQNNGRWVLFNYFHLRRYSGCRWKGYLKDNGLTMLLDSGAFTVFNAQMRENAQATKEGRPAVTIQPITVEEYAAFIQKHQDALFGYINLDVIGDPVASHANMEALTRLIGQPPIPVWHFQSSWDELDKLIAQDYELICVGGVAVRGVTEQQKRERFTELFRRHPDQNFHILGLSSSLIWEFPFFSADGTTWTNPRRFGTVMTPMGTRRVPDGWDKNEAIAFSIRQLAQLEWSYGFLQLELA